MRYLKRIDTEQSVAVFTQRAMAAIQAETAQHGASETGGLLLGHRREGIHYVVEAVDPGPGAVYQRSYFSYDEGYVNHLMNKLRWYYRVPLGLLGIWHRHPGSMDRFSGMDRETNARFFQLYPEGIVSGIVNVDPAFRMTLYGIWGEMAYTLPVRTDTASIPPGLLAYREERPTRGLRELLCRALGRVLPQPVEKAPLEMECLLEQIEGDLSFLGSLGATLSLVPTEGELLLVEVLDGKKETLLSFGGGRIPRMGVDGIIHLYRPHLLRDALTAYYLHRPTEPLALSLFR